MNVRIEPSRPVGTVAVPPSKSMAHRMLICAALAQGVSVIENVEFSEDIAATCDCLRGFGADLSVCGDTVTVTGCGGDLSPASTLPCRESGSTLRFLLPLALCGVPVTFTGSGRLMERPLSVYEEIFAERGIPLIRSEGSVSVQGTLRNGVFRLRGDVSSQFLTGLLFRLPLAEGESRIEVTTPLESASYLDLTLSALKRFGISVVRESERVFVIPGSQHYRPCNVKVEGDESNAAFFGALSSVGGSVTLTGRDPETLQGDRVWAEMFRRLRKEFCTLSVEDCPDLAPVLMTVAALNHGGILTDTHRLQLKESDRGAVMAEELEKFGAKIRREENCIRIDPAPLNPPTQPLFGHNDHRAVMSLAVIACKYGGVIEGAEAVRKSFPSFFERLKNINVKVEEL